jgi:ferrochelatase
MTATRSSDETPLGVLLVNLGTPDGADVASVRRFLGEFLSDPRVVELPRLLWLPALYGVILNTRPARSAKAYQAIWNKERNEGPLKSITRAQAEKLAESAAQGAIGAGARMIVDFAMRYGTPSINERINALCGKGCKRILIMPLYPQYAASTTATVFDAVAAALKRMRLQPALRFAPPYYDDPAYIAALADGVRAALAELDFEPEVILTSFHGLPRTQIERGDPYESHCKTTWRLLREALGRAPETFPLTFQSRFGPAKWLGPYTSDVVAGLASKGVRRIAIATPGFAADCLETLEEIGVEIRDAFLAAGGEKFARLPRGYRAPRACGLDARRRTQGVIDYRKSAKRFITPRSGSNRKITSWRPSGIATARNITLARRIGASSPSTSATQ